MSKPAPIGRIPDAIPDAIPDTIEDADKFVFDPNAAPIQRLVRSGIPVTRLVEIANADAAAGEDDEIEPAEPDIPTKN